MVRAAWGAVCNMLSVVGWGRAYVDPRQRERNDALLVQQVQQQIQLAGGEHPAQVSLAMSMSMSMPIPRTRQPAASRRSSGASSRAMSPRTEDRRGRAEAGVVLGEPSPFVPSR